MKRLIIKAASMFVLLIGSGFLLTSLAAEDVRNLKPFYGIGISVHAEVYYTQGNNHEIRIEGNERDVKDLITEINNGFLQVKYDNNRIKRSKLIIHITSKEVESVKISGSSQFKAKDPVSSEEMDLAMSGSGGVTFNQLDSDEVDVKISGSGSITLHKGKADEMGVKISGSGKLQAEDFEVSECSIAVSGSGNCRITATDELDVKLSGSGKVYYRGNPQLSSVSSGSGKVVEL
jgi:hypothetical protein